MSLIWHEVSVDTTDNIMVKVQNRSMVPESKIYVFRGTTEPIDDNAHIVTSRQIIELVLQHGERLFYATENGGIFVHSVTKVIKLKNYDVPTHHELVEITTEPVNVQVPEGSTFAIQNQTDSYVSVKFGEEGSGSFVLSRYQLFAQSITEDSIITILPSPEHKLSKVSYSIAPSAVVTQFSESTQTMIDNLRADVVNINNNMVTLPDIKTIEGLIYHNRYSSILKLHSSATSTLKTNVFKVNQVNYNSQVINDNDEISILCNISLTYLEKGISKQSIGVVLLSGLYRVDGSMPLHVTECTNSEIGKRISYVNILVNNSRECIQAEFKLNEEVLVATIETAVKTEHAYFDLVDEVIVPEFISHYELKLVNRSIVYSNDDFIETVISLFDKLNKSFSRTLFNVESTNVENISYPDGDALVKNLFLSSNTKLSFAKYEDSYKILLEVNENSLSAIGSKIEVGSIELVRPNFEDNTFLNLHLVNKSISKTNADGKDIFTSEISEANGSLEFFDEFYNNLQNLVSVNLGLGGVE